MRYTYKRVLGKTWRIDQREPYARRRFIVTLVMACWAGFGIGLAIAVMMPAPSAEEMGCYEQGTPCYEHLYGDDPTMP